MDRKAASFHQNSMITNEKRQQLWLSDLCVKYGELSITPSASSLSSSCYSTGTESATDYEIDQILLGNPVDDGSWMEETASEETASSYEYYWSKSNTG